MTDTFDWEREIIAAFRAPNLARTVEHLRTRIEAAFVPVETVATVDAALARATARAEAAEARNKVLQPVLDAILQHEASGFFGPDREKHERASYRGVIRKAKKARQALGGEHER